MEPVELLRWGDLGGQGPARFLAEGRRHKGLDSTAEGQEGPRSRVSGDCDCLNQNKSTEVLSWGGGWMETALTLGSEDMGGSLSPALQPWLGRHCSLADSADAPTPLLPGHLLSQVPLWQRVVMWQSSGQWDVSRRQWGLLGKLLLYLIKGRDMAVPALFPTSSFCLEQKHDGWSTGSQLRTMKQQDWGEAGKIAEIPGLTQLYSTYS